MRTTVFHDLRWQTMAAPAGLRMADIEIDYWVPSYWYDASASWSYWGWSSYGHVDKMERECQPTRKVVTTQASGAVRSWIASSLQGRHGDHRLVPSLLT